MGDRFGIFGTVIRIRKLSLLLVVMLRIPNNHCLLFPLRGHEFVTVFCQLASIVYLFGHLRGRQIKREEKCDEGGVGGGCWEIRDGDAGRYPWPSSSMATRKKMTCGSLMS